MTEIRMPSFEICERARASRDARFDGLFFIAVRSTGIYCRPVCPAPTAKTKNIIYYPTAAAAAAAGFRPCLRCRPELSPGVRVHGNENALQRALELIADGALQDSSIEALASQVDLSARQLRRLFLANAGATPIAVYSTRRLLLAKQLLTETSLPVTEVALASGFRSLRRFNSAFREACGIAPSMLRRSAAARQHAVRYSEAPKDTLTLRLAYRPPFSFTTMLSLLAKQAIPRVEHITPDSYERTIAAGNSAAWIRITAAQDKPELRLEISGTDPRSIPDIVRRARKLFDLDADIESAHSVLRSDPLLASCIKACPGLRIPGSWDGFELMIRSVLSQHRTNGTNSRLTERFIDLCCPKQTNSTFHPDRIFPSPEQILNSPLEQAGISRSRVVTIRAIAAAVIGKRLDFRAGQLLHDFVERITALPGIGNWMANYVAMRALNHPDAFPASDPVLQQKLGGGYRISERETEARSQAWRPWRAYAVWHLWNSCD